MYIKKIIPLILVSFVMASFTFSKASEPVKESSGYHFILTVIEIEGAVQILDAGKNEWISIEAPYNLNKDDMLRTLSQSSCVIGFDSSRLKLKENTEFKIKGLIEKINLGLEYGEILIKLENLPKDSSFEIQTPQAIAGVRGTRYRVSASKEKPATRVAVFKKTVRIESVREPVKYVVMTECQEREISPWQEATISSRGTGVLSEKALKSLSLKETPSDQVEKIDESEYQTRFGADAAITTRRAAVVDAYRKLAEKIYGVVIEKEVTLGDYAVKFERIRKTVKGAVRGATEIKRDYYSNGSIKVVMEIKALKLKEDLVPATGDIYGIDCLSGPEVLEKSDFEKFLF